MAKDSHSDVAKINVSGSDIRIGVYEHDDLSVYIQTEDNAEPIYMNTHEAELFVAAIQAAKARAKGED